MSLFNNGPTKIAFGFGLGIMAAELVKELRPAFRGLGRPLLKAAVKSGVILAGDGREKFARFRETLADVTAEVQAEMKAEMDGASHSTPTAPPPTAEKAKANAGVM